MTKESYILLQLVLVGVNEIKMVQEGQQVRAQGFIFKNKKKHWKKQRKEETITIGSKN